MNAQPTPGPWFVQESPVLSVVCAESHPTICELTDQGHAVNGDELVATARLIAAAPDLLEALTALRNECSGAPNPSKLLALLANADLVIAKAGGAA